MISELLDPGSVNLISIAKHSGEYSGITSIDKPENYWMSMELMEHRIIGLLGGRAATEVISGQIDVGSESDIRRAFNIMERFVAGYCAYGFDGYTTVNSSNTLVEKKDQIMSCEMERYYKIAKKMIMDNKAFFDAVVGELLERKTLTGKNLIAIKNRTLKLHNNGDKSYE